MRKLSIIKTVLDNGDLHATLQSTKKTSHCLQAMGHHLKKQTPISSVQKQIASDSVDTQCALYSLQISDDASFPIIIILK